MQIEQLYSIKWSLKYKYLNIFFFFNTHKFSNPDKNKSILSLQKGVYPYECMDDWEKFNELSLPEKEDLHGHLNMENITDADYAHTKRVIIMKCRKILWFVCSKWYIIVNWYIWELSKYVFEIYKLHPARFLSAPGLAWQAALKKTKVKLDLLTDINMLLMVEKGTRWRICHSIYRYAKANNKYMKDYDKNKESSYLQYWDVNNLMVGHCCKSLQEIILNGSRILLNLIKIS